MAAAAQATIDVEVTITGRGGHGSMPPTDGSTSVERLARFINAVALCKPAPSLRPPVTDFLRTLGHLGPVPLRPLLVHSGHWCVQLLDDW